MGEPWSEPEGPAEAKCIPEGWPGWAGNTRAQHGEACGEGGRAARQGGFVAWGVWAVQSASSAPSRRNPHPRRRLHLARPEASPAASASPAGCSRTGWAAVFFGMGQHAPITQSLAYAPVCAVLAPHLPAFFPARSGSGCQRRLACRLLQEAPPRERNTRDRNARRGSPSFVNEDQASRTQRSMAKPGNSQSQQEGMPLQAAWMPSERGSSAPAQL